MKVEVDVKGNRLATVSSALLLAGIAAAIYFREPAEQQVAGDPGQGSALGLAGLFGIAVAMVVVRLTVGSK